MNTALWIIQILLAVVFSAAGCMKLFAYDKYKQMTDKNRPSNLGRGLVTFIGMAEIAGALGLVIPMAANIDSWLSPLAAAGLATVMLLAVVFHVQRKEPPLPPAVLLLLTLFVAVGRLSNLA